MASLTTVATSLRVSVMATATVMVMVTAMMVSATAAKLTPHREVMAMVRVMMQPHRPERRT